MRLLERIGAEVALLRHSDEIDHLNRRTLWLLQRQTEVIKELRALRELEQREREYDHLHHSRHMLELVEKFRACLDEPDSEEMREAIEDAIVDLADEVARAEEHLL